MRMDANDILVFKKKIAELEEQLTQATDRLSLQDSKIEDLQNDLGVLQTKLFDYFKYGHDLKNINSGLKSELSAVYASTRWKITQPLWSLKEKLSAHSTAPQSPSPVAALSASAEDNGEASIPLVPGKKSILVIDRCILRPDHDAGSLSTFQYIGVLLEMGFNITFFGDDFGDLYAKDTNNYIKRLEDSGVQVLFGEYYFKNYPKWLSAHAKNFSHVLLNRPNIASKYMDIIKNNSQAKIIYMGHDLHFLREQRDYAATGDASALERSRLMRQKERWVIQSSDSVLMFNHEEKEIIEAEFGALNVFVSPLYYFEDFALRKTPFDQTKNLLFVGGFSHKPNADGVDWFLSQIWPAVKDSLDGAKIVIVGSSPPEHLARMADKQITFTGFATADELDSLYRESRLCVIPLRFGAGVKGKTLEAIHNGIPIVTTSIGIEGMPGLDKVLPPADTNVEFAEQIIHKYNNPAYCMQQSEECMDYLEKHYAKGALIRTLKKATEKKD